MKTAKCCSTCEVLDDINEFFGYDIKKARAWLVKPNDFLGGLIPLDLVLAGNDTRVAGAIRNMLKES
jgi:hypothetical protein